MDSLLLDISDVAALIGFSPATIENWAYRRKPSPYGFPHPFKIGRLLKYRRRDINSWIDSLGSDQSSISARKISSEVTSDCSRKRARGRPRKMDDMIGEVE